MNYYHIVDNFSLLIYKLSDLPILQKGVGVQLQRINEGDYLTDIENFNLKGRI